MLKSRTIVIIILSVSLLHSQSQASTEWTVGDYNIPYPGWSSPAVLNIYNNVTVQMFSNDVGEFNMYNNSKLTMYDGYISTLNLYPDTTAIIKGGDIHYLWIDPATTGWVKLYAYDMYISPLPDSHGYLAIHGYWLADNSFFSMQLANGTSTYSHIQFIPEPATIVILALGGLGILKRRKR